MFKVGANKLFACTATHVDRVDVTVNASARSHVGRYGWVTVEVPSDETLAAAREWMRERYRPKAPANVRDAAFTGA